MKIRELLNCIGRTLELVTALAFGIVLSGGLLVLAATGVLWLIMNM